MRHPCFDSEARKTHSRIHLPVAPKCNVQCQFCNRQFDCLNESRPGVTSGVLTPPQALWYLREMIERDPSISTVGIAGPGDPFANPAETMATLRRVRAAYPDMILCVSSNGLGIASHIQELAQLGVSHVTITINALDPDIGGQIYRWIRDGDEVYRGGIGARRILLRQMSAIRALKRHGITVKVNSIFIPGVNDQHILEIAKGVKVLGADLFNLMSLKPVVGTAFADIPEPDTSTIRSLRKIAEHILPQMPHCSRCRADAVGKIGCGNPDYAATLMKEAANMDSASIETRPYVAVCSMEGVLVNQHLGHTDELLIYAEENDCFRLVDVRKAPDPGMGPERWQHLAEVVHDCRAVVASAAGSTPEIALAEHGVKVLCSEGTIEDALELVFAGRLTELRQPACRSGSACSTESCGGGGMACA